MKIHPIICTFAIFLCSFIDITKHGYVQAQPIFIENKVVKPATKSHHECEKRYEIVANILHKYKRPFTLLDIGSSQGYYTFKSAAQFPDSVFVMCEWKRRSQPLVLRQLYELCIENKTLGNYILLTDRLNEDNINNLADCEHFDVVLAFSLLQRFGSNWPKCLDAISRLGSIILFDLPIEGNEGLEKNLIERGAQCLFRGDKTNSFKLYALSVKKNQLTRSNWIRPLLNKPIYLIKSDFLSKKLHKLSLDGSEKRVVSTWIPGINLLTFKMLGGIFPHFNEIQNELIRLRATPHSDWRINNMVLQGMHIQLVDFDDTRWGKPIFCPDARMQWHYDLLKLFDKREIRRRFLVGTD